MAQQIQFIYLTQSEYDALASKSIGRIYFTSDTHRIYKGSDLYAATTFDQLNFSSIEASSITVDGSAVSLEGHSHSMSDIDGLAAAISAATSGFASEGHTHVIGDIQSLTAKVSGLTSNKVEKTNGSFTNLSATNLTVVDATFEATTVSADAITVGGVNVALEGHTHSMADIEDLDIPTQIWASGSEVDSAVRIITESTPVVSGSESQVISQAALTTGVANVAGLKGYRYTNTGNVTNSLTFETAPTGWAAGDVVSIVNSEKYENCATIASISETTVTFTENLPFASIEDDDGWDAKLVYVSEKPTVGDVEIGYGAYAEGLGTNALNIATHAEGLGTKALGHYAHAEGRETIAQYAAHAEGYGTRAIEEQAHSEGYYTTASGKHSHAEGCRTQATKSCAHSEGENTIASGNQSHSEGYNTTASASQTHAEGNSTKATANQAHAEGNSTTASGTQSHAEGYNTTSGGGHSHSEGSWTNAGGSFSHAEGRYTKTQNAAEHAEGQFNKSNKANANFGNAGNTIHSIGIGTTESTRKNAVEVMQNGKVYIKDAGGYDGTNPTGSGVKDIATILSTVASSTHTHPELSGLTSSSITKDTGTFTNLVVTNASLDATSITASGVEVNGGIQASTVSASSATFQTLTVTGEVTMSLSSVDFQNINASSLTVNGSAVSLEGHSHSASEISGLDAAISAATSSFAASEHTHDISDITSLATKVSGLTSSKVEKTNGVFTNLSTTNLVVSSATIDAISIEASSMTVNGTGTFNAVSASTATFGDINVTGTASLSTTNVTASTLTAGAGSFTTLTVGGSNVALEGHGHSIADIEDYEDNTFWITGSVNTQTLEIQVDQDFENAVEAADAGKHIRAKLDYTGNDDYVCPWVNTIYTTNGSSVTGFDFHIMLDTDTLNPDQNWHPYLISVTWDSDGFHVRPYELSETNHDHDDVYASISHSHAISDVTDLSTILSGITSSSVEKDTITADIGNFRLLSVSGSANFSVNNVSANAVTVNGTSVALQGHTHSVADVTDLSTALSAYASASHSHAISDITNLQATLSGFASSGHTHDELAGITSTSISKANGSFNALTASTATFGTINVTSSATFDITNLVADTITVSDLDLTGTLTVSSTAVSAMTVTDLSVTGTLMLNSKSIATQEYVQLMISQAIGQILASAY